MTIIRHRMRAQTAVLPHQGNKRIAVPNRATTRVKARPGDRIGFGGLLATWNGGTLESALDLSNQSTLPQNSVITIIISFRTTSSVLDQALFSAANAAADFTAQANGDILFQSQVFEFAGIDDWSTQDNTVVFTGNAGGSLLSGVSMVANGIQHNGGGNITRTSASIDQVGSLAANTLAGAIIYNFQVQGIDDEGKITQLHRWFADEGAGINVKNDLYDSTVNPITLTQTEDTNFEWVAP